MDIIDILYMVVLLMLLFCIILLILAGYRCKWNAFWKQVSSHLLVVEIGIFLLAIGINFIIIPYDLIVRLVVLVGVGLMTGFITGFTPLVLRNILGDDLKKLFNINNKS